MELKMKILASATATLFLSLLFIGSSIPSSGGPLEITSIEGTVTDTETGDPIAGVTVTLWKGDGTGYGIPTDEDGYYLHEFIRGGTYYLEVSSVFYEDDFAEVVIGIGDSEVVDFELVPLQLTCSVQGKIIDSESGEPIRCNVYINEIDGDNGQSFYVRDDGNYNFILVPGRYRLTVDVNYQYTRYYSDEFLLEDGGHKEMNVIMEKLKQGIIGKVTNDDGLPISGATITIESYFAGRTFSSSTMSNEDGDYELRISPGDYDLSVYCDGCRSYKDEITVEEEVVAEYDITLKETTAINFIRDLIRTIMNMIGIM